MTAATRRFRALAWWSGLLCLLLRLPFVARRLWDHDSVQFALGVEHYDLAAHQPHPPGYPLYIALLKVLAFLGLAPGPGMVTVTLAASALGAACMPLLIAELTAPRRGDDAALALSDDSRFNAALFASALFIFNPILWFYGELPLLYAVEGALTVVLAWTVARMVRGSGAVVLAAAVLALAGGLRPSSMVLLGPLFLFGLWRSWRRGALRWSGALSAAAVGGVLVLGWALPLFAFAGGYRAWKEINDEHFRTLLPATSVLYGAGLGALRHNLLVLAKWAVQGLFPGGLVLIALLAAARGRMGQAWRAVTRPGADRAGFLAAWALPAIAFFALFHITKAGYTLVHLPALLAALALGALPLLTTKRHTALASLAVAALGAGLFLAGPGRVAGEPAWQVPWRHEFHAAEIRAFERQLDEVRAIAKTFSPANTVLASVELEGRGDGGASGFLYSWHRHLQWYLPEFTVLSLVPEAALALRARGHVPFETLGTTIAVPAGIERVLFVLAAPPDERFALPPGEALLRGERFFVWSAALPVDGRLGPFVLERAHPAGG